MKNKKEFLEELRLTLKKNKVQNIDSILEYYDEMFEDKKEQGKKDREIIKEIGNIENIINNIKEEQRTNKNKRSFWNDAKTVFAILGVISLPLLIPFAIVIIALIFSMIVVFLAFFITFGAVMVSGIFVLFSLFAALVLNKIPFVTFITILGLTLILVALMYELCRLILKMNRKFFSWVADKIERKLGVSHE